MDSDYQKSIEAAAQWGGEAFISIQDAARHPVDVVVVATPDDTHEAVLNQIYGWGRVIFAEKPFTRDFETARILVQKFNMAGQAVAVNYTRRFSPTFQGIQGLRLDRTFGDFLGGSGFYGNGLYHSGAHMIDLLRMLLGEVSVQGAGVKFFDAKQDDPSVFGVLLVAGSPFYLGVIPRPCVNAFELTLYFTNAVIRITDIGRLVELYQPIPRPDLPTEMVYPTKGLQSFDMREPMMVAVQNIKDYLLHGTRLLSTGENALEVLKICQAFAS